MFQNSRDIEMTAIRPPNQKRIVTYAEELRKSLLSDMMAISKAGSFLLYPVRLLTVHARWSLCSVTSYDKHVVSTYLAFQRF